MANHAWRARGVRAAPKRRPTRPQAARARRSSGVRRVDARAAPHRNDYKSGATARTRRIATASLRMCPKTKRVVAARLPRGAQAVPIRFASGAWPASSGARAAHASRPASCAHERRRRGCAGGARAALDGKYHKSGTPLLPAVGPHTTYRLLLLGAYYCPPTTGRLLQVLIACY